MRRARTWILLILGVVCACGIAQAQWYQGPSGGSGGTQFDFWKESGGGTDVSGVGVIETGTVRCLVIVYRGTPTNPGRTTDLRHGSCGTGAGEIGFDGSRGMGLDPDEYLLGVSGRYGDHIDSIRFFTNKRNSPVWGGSGGNRTFGYTAPAGQMIVAFTGRAGDNLDALGVVYAPCPKATKACR
jgi:Jacalin-like lectin domain